MTDRGRGEARRAAGRDSDVRTANPKVLLIPPANGASTIRRSLLKTRVWIQIDRACHQLERIDQVVHLAKMYAAAGDADNAVRALEHLSQMAAKTRYVLRRAGRV